MRWLIFLVLASPILSFLLWCFGDIIGLQALQQPLTVFSRLLDAIIYVFSHNVWESVSILFIVWGLYCLLFFGASWFLAIRGDPRPHYALTMPMTALFLIILQPVAWTMQQQHVQQQQGLARETRDTHLRSQHQDFQVTTHKGGFIAIPWDGYGVFRQQVDVVGPLHEEYVYEVNFILCNTNCENIYGRNTTQTPSEDLKKYGVNGRLHYNQNTQQWLLSAFANGEGNIRDLTLPLQPLVEYDYLRTEASSINAPGVSMTVDIPFEIGSQEHIRASRIQILVTDSNPKLDPAVMLFERILSLDGDILPPQQYH